jgi:hypothetical protein
MSDNDWMRERNAMLGRSSDDIDMAEELSRLRTELAAEREQNKAWQEFWGEGPDAINDLRSKNTKLREALEKAQKAIAPIASLVAVTPDGFPDHDICPIRLGQARALADASVAIGNVLKDTGGGDE